MEKKSYFSKLIIYIFALSLFISIALFFGVKISPAVKAEEVASTYTVTFYQEHLGFENIVVTVNAGDTLTESSFPATPADEGVHEYVWSYSASSLQNINSNVTVNLVRRINPSLMHTVTFIFPDGTTKSVQVVHGEDITDPPTSDNLTFGQSNTYSAKLTNITSDMQVLVGVNQTVKYVVMAVCGAVIVAGLVVIVFVVINMLNKDEESEEVKTEASTAENANTENN